MKKPSVLSTLPGALCVLAVLIGVATGWLGSYQDKTVERSVLRDLALPPPPDLTPPGAGNPSTLSFDFRPKSAKPGEEVRLFLTDAVPVTVYLDGQPLSQKCQDRTLIVTVPAGAKGSAWFAVEWEGKRITAGEPLTVETVAPPPPGRCLFRE